MGLRKNPPAESVSLQPAGTPAVQPHETGSLLEDLFNRIRKGPPAANIDPATRDDARVLLLNYSWPGLI